MKTVKYTIEHEGKIWVAHINGARRNLAKTRIGSYIMLCNILAREWEDYAI